MALYSIETHGELHPYLSYEWLLANGIGAFAHGTVVGCNTRRYHGLLVAATMPPVGRVMTLNRVGELVFLDGSSEFLELSINRFRSSVHPRGDRYLRKFELDNTIRWHFNVEGVRIVKELMLVWGRNLAAVRYRVETDAPRQVELHLLPFVSLRDFHSLRHKAESEFSVSAEGWRMSTSEAARHIHFVADAGQFQKREQWWFGHTYPLESERGLSDTEDLFVPGILIHKLPGSGSVTLWFTTDEKPQETYNWDEESARRPELPKQVYVCAALQEGSDTSATCPPQPATPTVTRLLHAAADFVVARKRPDGTDGTTIIAGYPWFSDWGRDTMISLPGLLLTPGRFKEAAQVLTLFADYVSEGMIPNRFDDYTNEPSYNTVDASLWFIHAAFAYLRTSGDHTTFNSSLLAACRAIVKGYMGGTRYNIHMDGDGLIIAGDASTQLTWMDARCDGVVFTPRHGKAVEINALWYNALKLLGEEDLAQKVRESFVKTFWQNPFRGLYDVAGDGRRDAAIRPNQIFAASLPYSPLGEDQQRAVVEVVRRELLTPFGLRTLAKSEQGYQGHYRGAPMQRDRAYHNGTVWAWLIGPFLDAYLRTHGRSADAMRQARVWLMPLIEQMKQACVGQIGECFEGDDPHRPVAAPAQAWSVAEALRLAVELGIE